MRCRDIPTMPILEFLEVHGGIGCHWFGAEISERSVTRAMPKGIPEKLILAKMQGLISKNTITGCACGCRGDFTLADKGKAKLKEIRE